MDDDASTVLVVDDEHAVCDLYARYIAPHFRVLTAYGGREALDRLDSVDPSVDVVLLDRQMPGMGGDETLSRIREAGYQCRVAMVTAIDPDFDILEMPFDEYVSKPVSRDELVDVVRRLLRRAAYAETVRQYYSLVSTASALADAKPRQELATSEEYRTLLSRIDALEGAVDTDLPAPDDRAEWAALLDDVLRRG